MRDDTREIAELMDRAAELVEMGLLKEAEHLLPKIIKLLTQWVERHLAP
ncbi:hypothetical protein ES703_13511 [subsurface metagenome]